MEKKGGGGGGMLEEADGGSERSRELLLVGGCGGNEYRVATCTFADLVEVPLQVVAVQFGSAEDEGAVHVVLLDGSHHVLSFQYLHRLRVRLCKHMHTDNLVQYVSASTCTQTTWFSTSLQAHAHRPPGSVRLCKHMYTDNWV